MKLLYPALIFIAPVVLQAAESIDRKALVTRHNVTLKKLDAANPLQVGNGHFAFGFDVTGLQTYTTGTFSDWGWHTFPNPARYREEETWAEIVGGGGRKAHYAYNRHLMSRMTPQQKKRAEGAYDWYRRAPHRLPLGRIGFQLRAVDGSPADFRSALRGVRQTLDLWTGTVHSEYELDGAPVSVTTCCHPRQDMLAVQVRSKLLASGRLQVFWDFPYVEFNRCRPTWAKATHDKHRSEAVTQGSNRVKISRTLDADQYFVSVVWSKGQWTSTGPHRFLLTPEGEQQTLSFVCGFAPQPIKELPGFSKTATASAKYWAEFWQSGGAIDLSGSKDPRWRELERRIVLSQYLTAVNSTGSSPPQESGLFSNSWYGKFHLEMTAWHGVHFVLWGRSALIEDWMEWMRGLGLESARRQAEKQGYKGARWMKMIGPDPKWESPSGAVAFRMTQQGHAIYWAELMYRQRPTRETLEQYKEVVMQSAEFMADYVWWDEKTGRYVLGPPLLSGSEGTPPFNTYNSTVELSYWFYGLRTAQRWRERLGLAKNDHWDRVLAKLSKPPVVNGLCADAESHPGYDPKNTRHGRLGRPAWLEAYGCMAGDEIDLKAMSRTFDSIWGDIQKGVRWQIWGCDFPMLAMTATRLNRPRDAVDALLLDHKRNVYLPNGFNNSGSRPYLPASGGLLWAAAMMAAGWEGGPDRHAPGFPDDGSWVVRHEGLTRAQ